MNPFVSSLVIGAGAALGANARFWFGYWWTGRFGSDYPWHTLLINLVGSILLGAFMAFALLKGWGVGWRLFVAVGFAGGFTTFSTFSAEVVNLIEEGRLGSAGSYMLLSVGLSVLGCWAGAHLSRMWASG